MAHSSEWAFFRPQHGEPHGTKPKKSPHERSPVIILENRSDRRKTHREGRRRVVSLGLDRPHRILGIATPHTLDGCRRNVQIHPDAILDRRIGGGDKRRLGVRVDRVRAAISAVGLVFVRIDRS